MLLFASYRVVRILYEIVSETNGKNFVRDCLSRLSSCSMHPRAAAEEIRRRCLLATII